MMNEQCFYFYLGLCLTSFVGKKGWLAWAMEIRSREKQRIENLKRAQRQKGKTPSGHLQIPYKDVFSLAFFILIFIILLTLDFSP